MKQVSAIFVVVLLLTAMPSVNSLRIKRDMDDADYIFGNDRGELTAKWRFARGIVSRAFDYFEELINSKDSEDLVLDNYASPVTGRSIRAKTWASANANNYFYVEAYVRPEDKMMVRTQILQNNTVGRPNAAVLSINLHHLSTNSNNQFHYFPLFCREIFRGIVFDNRFFPKFVNNSNSNSPYSLSDVIKTVSISGADRQLFFLNQGSFLDNAKALYSSTPDLAGVMLENNGNDYFNGNAWEQALYPVDILNPVHSIPMHFTKFSMSVAVASGWYSFNASSSSKAFQAARYGLGTNSTDFQKSSCLPTGSDGSCTTEGAKSCGPDTEFKAVCSKSEFGGDCLYQKGTDFCFLNNSFTDANGIEKFGPNSRCIMGRPSGATEDIPLCLKVTAATTGSTNITFEDKNAQAYACTGTDVTVSGVTIRCPTTNFMATRKTSSCTDDCNGNGMCFGDGSTSPGSVVCRCFWGWSGPSCNSAVTYEANLVVVNPYSDPSGVGIVKLNAQITGAAFLAFAALIALN